MRGPGMAPSLLKKEIEMINIKSDGEWVSIAYEGDTDPVIISAEALLTFLEMNYPKEFRELVRFREDDN